MSENRVPAPAPVLHDEGFDSFGLDPTWVERVQPVLDALLDKYFRTQVDGLENLPAGRGILVANHGGALPWDVLMLQAALRSERYGAQRQVRPLIEDALATAPFLGTALNRLGGVRASQANATRLLDRDELIAVFPEGILGLGKRYRRRYKLQRFGRGGFVRLAIRTQTPIVPVAIVGAEDAAPLVSRFELAGRALGLPYLPVTPLFPLLGPVGLMPLPAHWSIRVGKPFEVAAEAPDPDDDVAVGAITAKIRESLQAEIRRLRDDRPKTYPWSKRRS